MKKYAKLAALLLALVLILSLAACRKAEQTKTPAAPSGAADGSDQETRAGLPETGTEPEPSEPEAPDAETPAPSGETDAPPMDTGHPSAQNDDPSGEAPESGSVLEIRTDPALIGAWQGEISVEDIMESSEPDETSGLETFALLVGDVSLRVNFEFTAAGEVIFSMDPASVEEMFDTLFENLPTILPSLYGMTAEEFNQLLAQENMTMDDFMEMMKAQINKEELIAGMSDWNTSAYYTVSGDRIHVDNDPDFMTESSNYMTYTVSGDKLTLVELVGGDNDSLDEIRTLLPWEFTRIS